MTKADKVIEDQVHAAFKVHGHGVQINIMDLGKVMDAGRNAGKFGTSIEINEAVRAAVTKYRQN